MKFPLLHAVLLIAAAGIVLAGCIGPQQQPATPAPQPTTTGNSDIILAQYFLSPSEMPFAVKDEQSSSANIYSDPSFRTFGALRGMTLFAIDQKPPSPTATQLGQMIVQYPPGNSTRAFEAFVRQNRNETAKYNITWLPDPGLGDASCALRVPNSPDTGLSTAMIVFRKSDYMESVVMISSSPDTAALTKAARVAASKIP